MPNPLPDGVPVVLLIMANGIPGEVYVPVSLVNVLYPLESTDSLSPTMWQPEEGATVPMPKLPDVSIPSL